METKQVEITYVPYVDAFRIYDAYRPEYTFAYANTLEEAIAIAEEYKYGTYIVCEN